MNITSFEKKMTNIEYTIDEMKLTVIDKLDFSNYTRKQFNKSLENILDLLKLDESYKTLQNKTWHIAYRLVHFRNLYSKIAKIRKKILNSQYYPPYFTKKIRDKILPPLSERIEALHQHIGSMGRLPFKINQVRNEFLESVRSQLALKNSAETKDAEIEYFNLLSNSLDPKKIELIDLKSYDIGSYEIYSLESWGQILSLFVKEGNQEEKRIGKILLGMIDKSKSSALKISYMFKFLRTNELGDKKAEEVYFKNFLEWEKKKEQKPKLRSSFNHFLDKHTLDQKNSIPNYVLKNEIAWDILTSIHQMQQGKSRIFSVGIEGHSIVIEVTCEELASFFSQGKYTYKIFNTGQGIKFHDKTTDDLTTKVRPIIFYDLPKEAFSYDFLMQLIQTSLKESDIDNFYQLHWNVLSQQAKGRISLESGAWHLSQKFGTCSYSAVEAWIHSYLNADQIKHLDYIKAKFSTQKQKKVVEFLEAEMIKQFPPISCDEINFMMIKQIDSQLNLYRESKKKLGNSKALLQLGEEYLQLVSKDLATNKTCK